MRTPLDKALRGKLEKTVEKARDIVEIAVAEALTRLGISDGSAPSYLSDEERKLRNRLRAHGRQLGDALNKESGKQATELLINEMSYEHWHRMLFARFLEQSDLLMYDQNTHVTLDECFELAEEEVDITDGWELAGQLAQKMLPQIFRADSPVFEVKLSINHVNTLEELIAELDKDTFQASDALGWCYQFWQNKKKKQVNESGVKIGAKELSPVTQLFTEPYMVSFLLDNALGAWWAKRRLSKDDLLTATSEQELRELAAIPGVPLEYLRFVQNEEACAHSGEKVKSWSNAAGDFDKWPEDLSELKTLDPCCGSGHFLVAKFLMLVPMRMELEALTAKQAIDKVIAENIHGLELDQRCVELAAFALALEAWRYPGTGGYRQLPELQLACSGMSINEAQKEWKDLAKDDEELQGAIQWMQQTFKNAATLGSLIKPKNMDLWSSMKPWELLNDALKAESTMTQESLATAKGLSKAAEILSVNYSWVITNPPYLGRSKQNVLLQDFCEKKYSNSKHELATVFLERLLKLIDHSGLVQLVLPQNWLLQPRTKELREKLLSNHRINMVAKLGPGAFEMISGEVVNTALLSIDNSYDSENLILNIDVCDVRPIIKKISALIDEELNFTNQKLQLDNEDFRISLIESETFPLLKSIAHSYQGIKTSDDMQFVQYIWEQDKRHSGWEQYQSSCSSNLYFDGKSTVVLFEDGKGRMRDLASSQEKDRKRDLQGSKAWGEVGISINSMTKLSATLYSGNKFDTSIAAIIPNKEEDLLPIWTYCNSEKFVHEIKKIEKRIHITNSTMVKVPFNKDFWKAESNNLYPNGLPKPYSNDPTQWIYHGHPCASVVWCEESKTTIKSELRQEGNVLQVAVARLLGYRWPAELDEEMELAPEMREVIAQNKVFEDLVDDDGIVCIPAIRGEKPAVDRLEAILHAAYGEQWSATILNQLLKSVKSRDLNLWLRDKFFLQHISNEHFQNRPFIWQVWDGLPDGFSALVNYHTLDYKGLERLIYTYLDDWISTQIQLEKDGEEGAELRLTAAQNLRDQLEAILVGEEGMDIFVRWKSLEEQPIGWNPDLNDGVRLNIRPFIKAKDVAKKDAGVLRYPVSKRKDDVWAFWKKDRGSDVPSAPWFDLGLEYGGKQGDRINDHHLTLAEKKAARDAK